MTFGTRRPHASRGFTLVELIVVIVISGILAAIMGVFIVKPIESYVDLDRRAELTDAADSALRLMARDIRSALPNSVRTDGANALELLYASDAGRYRAAGAGNILDFTIADAAFDLVAPFHNTAAGAHASRRLAVYNTNNDAAGAYGGSAAGIMTDPLTITVGAIDANTEQTISLSAGFRFLQPSPSQRIFYVEGPVSYVCNGGTLTRFSGYALTAIHPTNPAAAPLTGATSTQVVAAHVAACAFVYDAGTAQRAGLISLRLTLTQGGESVELLRQVRVDNFP